MTQLQKARDYEALHRPQIKPQLPIYHLTGGVGWINDPNGFAPLGYDAAMTVVYGIKAAEEQGLEAGSDEYKQAVIDAIAGGTIEGITGTFTFDEHHNPVKSTAILTYVDGKPELKEMF